ncbi:MAG TPA: DNA gyrase inhibitor YacG [Clostridia bacterium]|nr:DNA gyrase inhibitor YacG [Clostridia bacterium]
MPKKKTKSLRCPTCRTLVLANDENFPFCSDRCRVIDLGKWASGGYVISSPINDPESGGEAEYTDPHAGTSGTRRGPDSSSKNETDGRKPN